MNIDATAVVDGDGGAEIGGIVAVAVKGQATMVLIPPDKAGPVVLAGQGVA
jgi:hypothetical protein